MSRNLDAVRASYAASARGDIDGLVAVLAPDARWTEMAGFPYGGTYVGADDVVAGVFRRIGEEWDNYQAVPEQFVDGGDVIVVVGTYSGTYRATGRSMTARFTHVWHCEEGTAVAFEQFTDTLAVHCALAP